MLDCVCWSCRSRLLLQVRNLRVVTRCSLNFFYSIDRVLIAIRDLGSIWIKCTFSLSFTYFKPAQTSHSYETNQSLGFDREEDSIRTRLITLALSQKNGAGSGSLVRLQYLSTLQTPTQTPSPTMHTQCENELVQEWEDLTDSESNASMPGEVTPLSINVPHLLGPS